MTNREMLENLKANINVVKNLQNGNASAAIVIRELIEPRGNQMEFNTRDKAAFAALDTDFAIDVSGEIATVVGGMRVEITRPADDDGARFRLLIRFPGGEELEIKIARTQLLEQLNIEANEPGD